MKELIDLALIKTNTFSTKYWLNLNSINHWRTDSNVGSFESKLKILTWIKKHIEELTILYNKELKEIQELFIINNKIWD